MILSSVKLLLKVAELQNSIKFCLMEITLRLYVAISLIFGKLQVRGIDNQVYDCVLLLPTNTTTRALDLDKYTESYITFSSAYNHLWLCDCKHAGSTDVVTSNVREFVNIAVGILCVCAFVCFGRDVLMSAHMYLFHASKCVCLHAYAWHLYHQRAICYCALCISIYVCVI